MKTLFTVTALALLVGPACKKGDKKSAEPAETKPTPEDKGSGNGSGAEANAGAKPEMKNLIQQALTGVADHEAILSHVTIPPNKSLPKHYHPGEEFVYILDGTFTLWQKDKEDTAIKAGGSFAVPLNAIHTGITKDDGAVALAFRVHKKGQPVRFNIDEDGKAAPGSDNTTPPAGDKPPEQAAAAAPPAIIGAIPAAADPAKMQLTNVLTTQLAGMEGKEVIVSHVVVPPNTKMPIHYHPGEEFLYVASGSFVIWQKDKEDTVLKQGDAFTVPFKVVHTGLTKDEPATVLAFRVHDKNEPVRFLVDEQGNPVSEAKK